MADTGRISLYDCMIDLKMPALSSLPPGVGGKAPSLETIAGLTADGATRDLHAAYLGETVVLVVIVHVPLGSASSRDSLFFTLERLGETRVCFAEALGPSRPPPATRNALRRAPSSPRKGDGPAIPVLRESEWVQASSSSSPVSRAGSGESGADDSVVFAKAMCVLLRTPPEASRPAQLAAAQGRVRIAIVARERPPAPPPIRARAAAAISRAARIAGRPLALSTGKDLTVRAPLELTCAHFTAGGSATKAFVSISAVNVSTDAVLSVAPPFVHVTASRVVREKGRGRPRVAVSDGGIPQFDINTGTYLDEAYDFVPCFDASMEAPSKDDSQLGAHTSTPPVDRVSADETHETPALPDRDGLAALDDDLGLFIPTSCLARKSTVQLAPQEEFNFVYEITPRGCTSAADPNPAGGTAATDSSKLGMFLGVDDVKAETTENQRPLPRLSPGTVFETSVAVAWSCASRDALDAAGAPGAPVAAASPALERAFSSGGVLALGERRSVAVREVAVQWRPPALVEDVVVSFAGPRSATVRAHVPVTVTVRNQASRDLNSASLYVQRGVVPNAGFAPLLTPLRTAVALGCIPAGGSARVELLCVALKAGALTLGDVKVVDLEADGVQDAKDAPVWCAQSSFEVFVVDSDDELRKGGQGLKVSNSGQ